MIKMIVCPQCFNVFQTRDKRRKYCSSKCSFEASREKRRINALNYYYLHKEQWNKYRSDWLNRNKK